MAGYTTGAGGSFGGLRFESPTQDELDQLRRQQAQFRNLRGALDRQNSWMAAPIAAGVALPLALEGAGMVAARLAAPAVRRAALNLVQRDPYRRVGDNFAARGGRLEHRLLKERLRNKGGWKYEPDVEMLDKRVLKPDVGTPEFKRGDKTVRYYMELKPDTPSGRRAAAAAIKKYEEEGLRKVRAIFYNAGKYK